MYFCLVRFSFHLSISIQISKLNFFEIEFLPEWGTNCEPPGPEAPDLPMSQVTPLNILSVKTCSRDCHNVTGNVTLFIYYSVLLKLSNFFTMKTTYLGMNSEGNAPFIVHYTLGWAYWAGCKLKVKYEWRWLCFVREEKNWICPFSWVDTIWQWYRIKLIKSLSGILIWMIPKLFLNFSLIVNNDDQI